MIKNLSYGNYLLFLLFGLAVLILVPNDAWPLPPCSGQYNKLTWTDCAGTKIFAPGDRYEGHWKNGKFHGKGKLVIAKLGKYVGEFKDGQLHGKGVITFANGDKYSGQLRHGQIFGRGTYKYGLDGRVIQGVTENGNFPYEWEVTVRIKTFAESLK